MNIHQKIQLKKKTNSIIVHQPTDRCFLPTFAVVVCGLAQEPYVLVSFMNELYRSCFSSLINSSSVSLLWSTTVTLVLPGRAGPESADEGIFSGQ